MEESSRLEIFLLCFPTQGHLAPMLYLAQKLLSFGFSITVAVNEAHKDRLLRSFGHSFRIEGYADPFHGPVSDPQVVAFFSSDQQSTRISVHNLFHRLYPPQNPPCCIVFDPFLAWALDLARDLGVYSAAFWTSSPACLALHDYLPLLNQQGFIPVKTRDDGEKEITWMPGFPATKVSDFPSCFQFPDPEEPPIIYAGYRIRQVQKADWVLFNSFEELDSNIISHFPKGIAIGPLIPTPDQTISTFWEEDKSCIKWLDSKPPSSVIYVAFGSAALFSTEQLKELAHGLEDSGYSFLWVVRPNLAEGTEQFILDFSARNKDKGLVITWAPQIQVLNHPSVTAFLTHCGWNSTLECIYSGIPMLGWPCVAEQVLNCRFITDVWKVGLRIIGRIDQDLVKKDQVTNSIVKLMKEKEGMQVRKNATRFGIEARKAYAKEGSSLRNLEAFAHDLRRSFPRSSQCSD